MAFRNMNKRRHIGLQQLSVLASTGRTLLGPAKSSKFIVDESTHGSVLTCSAVRLLESLDLSSAVGQLLNEAIQAQNNEYKTGTTTLLFLVSAWSGVVLECLQQDVPLSAIAAVMSEGVNSCIEQVQSLKLPLENIEPQLSDILIEHDGKTSISICSSLVQKQIVESNMTDIKCNCSSAPEYLCENAHVLQEDPKIPTIQPANLCSTCGKCLCTKLFAVDATGHSIAKSVDTSSVFTVCKSVNQKTVSLQGQALSLFNCNKRPKLVYSRYLSSGWEGLSPQQTVLQNRSSKHLNELNNLGHLAMCLSHGNWSVMKLVQDILMYQLQTMNGMTDAHPFLFRISEVVTCCLPGMSENHSCVCPGYITLIDSEKAAAVKQFEGKPLSIVLADGEITETYHHLGFNKSQNVRRFCEGLGTQENHPSLWIDSMLDILNRFNVNLVLVLGNTCKALEDQCMQNHIMIINQVPHVVLKAFSDITGAEMVTYLTQVNERCVGKSVFLNLCRTPELNCLELDDQRPVALSAEGIHLVTAVLSCPVMSKMQAAEDSFWTCAYRVHHAFCDQAVFPGSGAVEFLCLSYLENLEKALKNSSGEFHAASSWLVKSTEQYKPLVLNALARGWQQYLCTVICNAGNCTSEFEASVLIQQKLRKASLCDSPSEYILNEFKKGKMGVANAKHGWPYEQPLKVYDNVTAKVEAWRRALDLVLLVLETDAEIITGPERVQLLKSQFSNDFVFL
uniref:Bardet-Biedl syndrome 12 n=1 Tax=Salvator merianae TaxID=96440 RepID=A0A8D0CE27_SALMN